MTATCGSLQYAATALFSDGSTQDATSTATWSSSSTSVASISNTGLATGIGLGTTNIGATFKGISATSEPLLVDQLNSITVSPSPVTAPQGSSVQFTAIGNFTFAAGGTSDLDVSSQVTWASSNTAVATVDNTGNATAVAPGGPINITATSCDGGTVGTAKLTVGAPAATSLVVTPAMITISTGTTTLFTAMEMFSDGTTHPPANPVTWSSGTTTVATIDPNSGVALGVTASTSGTSGITITATESTSGLTGTATLKVQAAAARFAYVANSTGNSNAGSISGYTVDVTGGTFTPLSGSPFSASLPQQVMIHPSGDFMYYIDFSGALHVEDIDSSLTSAGGSLSDSGQMAVPASSTQSANVGVIDPTGRFIYVISDVGNSIFGFSIKQTVATDKAHNGALTGIPNMIGPAGYTDPTLNSPVAIVTDRAGKYAYVVNNLGNSVSQYTIDPSSGALTLIGTSGKLTGASPFFATTDVNGHLYVANSGDQTVSAFTIGSGGVLAQIGSSNFPVATATSTVFNVLTDPTGKYLYVLDSPATTGHVFAYNLDSSGAITTQIGTAQATGQSPIGMAIDPTGALLAIDNNIGTTSVGSTISLYQVTLTGTSAGGLTPATPPTVNTDTAPQFVVFYTAAPGQ
ncbi:MAG TPA: Ig-like domain-containing protein [Candidatus Acidoferrales bacterium]|nr:Ig-like domain-containing protein [Candidatus Acidoferrales bacterium]